MDGCRFCGKPLTRRAEPRGRKRVYCSDACRVAAARHRASQSANAAYPMPETGFIPASGVTAADARATAEALAALLAAQPAADVEGQLARAVQDTMALAASLERLAGEVKPTLSWRARGLAVAMRDALRRFFDTVVPS